MDPRRKLGIVILGPTHASESFVETQQCVCYRIELDETRFKSFRAWYFLAKLSEITRLSQFLFPELSFLYIRLFHVVQLF